MDPVRDRITQLLKEYARSVYDLEQISGNLAFITKHVAGPEVKASQISVTWTEASYDNDYTGNTLTVSVHMSEGNLKVIASKEVEDETDILDALHVEVNKRIEAILMRDGEDALDDDE